LYLLFDQKQISGTHKISHQTKIFPLLRDPTGNLQKEKKKMACGLIQMYTIKEQLAFDLNFIIFVSSTRVS